MEYGRALAANFTVYERTVIIRAVIGINDGLLLPTDRDVRNVTVTDPLNDGVNRRVQWTPFGPLYRSGYCRNIVVVFLAKLAAGVVKASRSDDIPHPTYGGSYSVAGTAREFIINDDAPTVTAFSFHTNVIDGMFTTEFVLEADLIDEVTGATVITGCSLSPSVGYYGQQRLADGVYGNHLASIPTEVFEVDASGNGDVLYSSVRARAYPERQGGNLANTDSLYQELFYAVPKGQPFIDFWWSFGNSFITKDPGYTNLAWPPSGPRKVTTTQRLAANGKIRLIVKGPKLVGAWLNSVSKGTTQTQDPVTGRWTNTIVLYENNATNDIACSLGPNFPDGWAYPILKGTLFFDASPLTAHETSTFNALNVTDGSNYVTAVCSTWASAEDSYGPYGVVGPRPGNGSIPSNSFISSDVTAFASCGKIAYDDYNYFNNYKWANNLYPLYGFDVYGGGTADYHAFFYRGWWFSRSAFPDLRGLIRDSYLELNRPCWFKEEDGKTYNIANYQGKSDVGQQPKTTCDLVFYGFRPHFSSGGPEPNIARFRYLGKTQGRSGASPVGHRKNSENNVSGWTPWDTQHFMIDGFIYGLLLSGDIGMQYMLLPQYINQALCSAPIRDGVWTAKARNRWYYDTSAIHGYTIAAVLYDVPRAEARNGVSVPVHLYFVSGDQRLIRKTLLRKSTLWTQPEPAVKHPNLYLNTEPGRPRAFNELNAMGWYTSKEMATHCTGDAFQGSLSNHDCYNPWQALLLGQYLWAFIRALLYTDTSSADLTDVDEPGTSVKTPDQHATEMKDILYKFAKAFADHGFQKSPSTNNMYIPFAVVDWTWDAIPGKGLPQAIKDLPTGANGYSPNNPRTGLGYFMRGSGWHFIWTVNTVLIGYEIASERGDADYMGKFATLLDPAQGGFTHGTPSSIVHGWGTDRSENTYEVMLCVKDPFRSRSVPTISLPAARIDGVTLVTSVLSFDLNLVTTISGETVLSGEPTVEQAIVDLVGHLIACGTGIVLAEPIDPDDVLFAYTNIEPTLIAGETVWADEEPSLFGTSDPNLPAAVISGSTNITRHNLSMLIDPVDTHIVRLEASIQLDKLLKVKYQHPMPAKYQSFELPAGDTLLLRIKLTNTGTEAVDFNECDKIVWNVARSPNDFVVLTKSLASGLGVVDGTNLEINLEQADTANLKGLYYHELHVFIGANKYTLFTGNLTITESLGN